MFHILIAEDDDNTRKLMGIILKDHGYMPYMAADGIEALQIIDTQHIDLILMDVMMPRMDGYELTKQLRDHDYQMPILMVSARQMPEDKRNGFLAGTDDYITKPVDEEEMLLRIKALLRRSQIVSDHKLAVGDVTLDYDSLTVTRKSSASSLSDPPDETMTLPQKEFYLLYKLLSYPDKIFTRIQLMDEIWGVDSDSTDNTINVHINRLRKRFDGYPEFEIQTIRGLGYKAVKNV